MCGGSTRVRGEAMGAGCTAPPCASLPQCPCLTSATSPAAISAAARRTMSALMAPSSSTHARCSSVEGCGKADCSGSSSSAKRANTSSPLRPQVGERVCRGVRWGCDPTTQQEQARVSRMAVRQRCSGACCCAARAAVLLCGAASPGGRRYRPTERAAVGGGGGHNARRAPPQQKQTYIRAECEPSPTWHPTQSSPPAGPPVWPPCPLQPAGRRAQSAAAPPRGRPPPPARRRRTP